METTGNPQKSDSDTLYSILKERGILRALTDEKENKRSWQHVEDIYKFVYRIGFPGLFRYSVKQYIEILGEEFCCELMAEACSVPSYSEEKALRFFCCMCCESIIAEAK